MIAIWRFVLENLHAVDIDFAPDLREGDDALVAVVPGTPDSIRHVPPDSTLTLQPGTGCWGHSLVGYFDIRKFCINFAPDFAYVRNR